MSGGGDGRPAHPKLGKPLEFMRSLWALDHALQSRSKAMAAALGVTGPQRMVVRLVGRFPDIAAGSLAELLMVHPSTLTGIVQRLESRMGGGRCSASPSGPARWTGTRRAPSSWRCSAPWRAPPGPRWSRRAR